MNDIQGDFVMAWRIRYLWYNPVNKKFSVKPPIKPLNYTSHNICDDIILYTAEVVQQSAYLPVFKEFHAFMKNRLKLDEQKLLNQLCSIVKISMSKMLLSANKHVIELANQLFDVLDEWDLTNGTLQLNIKEFKTDDLYNDLIGYGESLSSDDVKFQSYKETYVPDIIKSDYDRIKQIIRALIKNAFEHTVNGSVILFITSSRVLDGPDEITFSIQDSGSGIDAAIQDELFKPHELAKNISGISLRISYLLAKLLGGELVLQSSERDGTIFDCKIASVLS